jgi:hypothetical protein
MRRCRARIYQRNILSERVGRECGISSDELERGAEGCKGHVLNDHLK